MDEEQEVPKKIALKVPSLFIKSASNSSQSKEPENGVAKKPTRPMPASLKKKLEEAQQNKDASRSPHSSSSVSQVSSVTSNDDGIQKKVSRPMPASARRKLEETSVIGDTNSDSSDSRSRPEELQQPSKPSPAKVKSQAEEPIRKPDESGGSDNHAKGSTEGTDKPLPKRPMPASARKKLEETAKLAENTDEVACTTESNSMEPDKGKVGRPMPASAKKMLEVKTDNFTSEKLNKSVTEEIPTTKGSATSESDIKKKVIRAMPASARRKLEGGKKETSDVGGEIANAKKAEDLQKMDTNNDIGGVSEESTSVGSKSDGKKDDEKVKLKDSKQTETVKDTSKINISLGGIKFPTFKKPMPASAKRKVEEKQTEDKVQPAKKEENVKEESISAPISDQEGVVDQSLRTSRRGKSSGTDFMALDSEKYPCETCGKEFYSLSSRNKHALSHIQKNGQGTESETKKTSTKPSSKSKKKNVKGSKYKGMTECPHCQQPFKNWQKIKNHVKNCIMLAKYECSECGKKFHQRSKLETHLNTHKKPNKDKPPTKVPDAEDAFPVPISPLEFHDDAVPSPKSVDSKASVVEKSRPMPKSMKAKLRKDSHEKIDGSGSETPQGGSVKSFKRKIADVLSNLGSKKFSDIPASDDEDEDSSPPRKKTILSRGGTENESIQGHPMPASVKKKLQDRSNKSIHSPRSSSAPATPKSNSDEEGGLDDLECEVCHRVFSLVANRQRHERNNHSIQKPRGRNTGTSPAVSKPTVTTPKVEEIVTKEKESPKFDINAFPSSGVCPICSKYIATRLRRHIRNVHKDLDLGSASSTPVKTAAKPKAILTKSPVVRPSAPKTYKIYKTATNKLKQKLASSISSKKPVISLEKLMPLVKVEEKVKKQENTAKIESNVIATTASSDLRCACCDKIFEVSCDFYEHMTMRHPKVKRLITCKLCEHKFSHEEDFFLHIQFKHPNLVADMKPKNPKSPSVKSAIPAAKKADSDKRNASPIPSSKRESSRQRPAKVNTQLSKKYLATVNISDQDKQRAEAALRKLTTTKSEAIPTRMSSRTTRQSSSSSRKPEPMEEEPSYDNDSDNHFEDSGAMDVEEESEIAITSTFSQKVASPDKKQNNASGSFDLDPMHCSTCSEVFYSYEALRKHELYFHNVKTTKMCPICGVYPTRLSRHLLAHENKTVRCSCVPCRLSFPDFNQLLKHNLEKHPGVKGGALCAPNKPRDQNKNEQPDVTTSDASCASNKPGKLIQDEQTKTKDQQSNSDDLFRCLLCKKEFPGSSRVKNHIRRTHSEQEVDPETLMMRVKDGDSVPEVDMEVEEILEDTTKKLLDPDWDADDDVEIEVPVSPSPPPSRTLRHSTKPMPASARAQLGTPNPLSSVSTNAPKSGGRPMPASVRAKMEAQKKDMEQQAPKNETEVKSNVEPKRAKPMPASLKAKLLSQPTSESENSRDSSSISSSTNKPRRPMPASVKAKLGMAKATDSVMGGNNSQQTSHRDASSVLTPQVILAKTPAKVKQDVDDSSEDVITLDDEPMDDSYPELEEPSEPSPPSVPTFSIADEIAEHNRAVRIAMGENLATESNFNSSKFQCKLCYKKFDTIAGARQHIRRSHSEYGSDHTENLIQKVVGDFLEAPRVRKSNTRYNEDYVEDDEEEVIIPRGTSRRPRGEADDPDWNSSSLEDSVASYSASDLHTSALDAPSSVYACRWCGTRKDSPGNIKRHIAKSHPHLYNQREQGIVIVGSNDEYVEPPPPPPPPPPRSATPKAGNPIYVCMLCSRCMAVRASLYTHIVRSHPQVGKGNAANFIQELNKNRDGSAESDESTFYCSICSYQTTDEDDYVAHYKNHTGVSPYQCQYCSDTFDRQQELKDHIARKHDFLANDEGEISMEEVVGSNQISVAATAKVHIDSPAPLSLSRRNSEENDKQPVEKKYTPGPASRKTAAAKKSVTPVPEINNEIDEPMDNEDSPPPSPAKPEDDVESNEETESQQQKDSTPVFYHGDLSSLFPTLGGGAAPGGIDALDDIDGGMDLD